MTFCGAGYSPLLLLLLTSSSMVLGMTDALCAFSPLYDETVDSCSCTTWVVERQVSREEPNP